MFSGIGRLNRISFLKFKLLHTAAKFFFQQPPHPIPKDIPSDYPGQRNPKNIEDIENFQMGKHSGRQHKKFPFENERQENDHIAGVLMRFNERN